MNDHLKFLQNIINEEIKEVKLWPNPQKDLMVEELQSADVLINECTDTKEFKFPFYAALCFMRRGMKIQVDEWDGFIRLEGNLLPTGKGDKVTLAISGGMLDIRDQDGNKIDYFDKRAEVVKTSLARKNENSNCFSIYSLNNRLEFVDGEYIKA